MRNAGLDVSQVEIKTVMKNINNFRYADDTTLMAEIEEKVKCLLIKVKEESEKAGLKLDIQKTNIMASDPIISGQTDGGGKEERVTGFIFLGSKITADGDCSYKVKILAPWKESYDKTKQHIKKWRHCFADKVCIVRAMDFSVVTCRCESWTIKKTER